MGIFVQGKGFGEENKYVMKKDISLTNAIEQLNENNEYSQSNSFKWDKGIFKITPETPSGLIWTINIDISAIQLFTDFTFSQVSNEKITNASLFTLGDCEVGYCGILKVRDGDTGEYYDAFSGNKVNYSSISHFFYYLCAIENNILKINFYINMNNYSTLTSLPGMNKTVTTGNLSVMRDGFGICRISTILKYNGNCVLITDTSKIYGNYETPTYNNAPLDGEPLSSAYAYVTYYKVATRDPVNAGVVNSQYLKSGDLLTNYASTSNSVYFYWLFAPKLAYEKLELTETLGTGYIEYDT